MSQYGPPRDSATWRLSPPPDTAAPVQVAMSATLPSNWQLAATPPTDGVAVEVARGQHEAPEVSAARAVAAQAAAGLTQAAAFRQLDSTMQDALLRDLQSIQQALNVDSTGLPVTPPDPLAKALETPADLMRRRLGTRPGAPAAPPPTDPALASPPAAANSRPATETLAARAGALTDEIDFPAFVAGLVHGTFDAIVDATIRQMESFASLVSAVAKDVDQFTRENVTSNQVRDWLVERYPGDLYLDPASMGSGQPRLKKRQTAREQDSETSPVWLVDFGMEGVDLNDEVIEEQLVPAARRTVGEQRLQMLAAMVLMGMSRVVVRDGTISARVKFRAAARDHAAVDYATSQDPSGGGGWGARGSAVGAQPVTMVSTVSANVQTDTVLDATLFGEVKINFASETLPLDRFVDAARLALLTRNSRPASAPPPAQLPAGSPASAPAAPPTTPVPVIGPANQPPASLAPIPRES